jgi:hypothetical protein
MRRAYGRQTTSLPLNRPREGLLCDADQAAAIRCLGVSAVDVVWDVRE